MNKIGEIVASTSTEFTAECYELHALPCARQPGKSNGTVSGDFRDCLSIRHGRYRTGQTSVARGKDEMSEEAVYQSSPQLMKLLRSEFQVLVVGHKIDGIIYQYLPSKRHISMLLCRFAARMKSNNSSQSFDFLSIMLNNRLQSQPKNW